MRITATIDGLPYVGREHGSFVVVPTPCPTCGQKHAVIDGEGVVRALSGSESLTQAQREVRAEYGAAAVLAPPAPEAGCRVRLIGSRERRDGWDGKAECVRCRTVIGELSVRVDTLFGTEEDRAVLGLAHARSWRVF